MANERDEAYDALVRRMVEDSCAEQGVPVKVTDPLTLRRVATLLGVRDRPAPPSLRGDEHHD